MRIEKIVNVLVEGETEYRFIKQINGHFRRFSLSLRPIIVETRSGFTGGFVKYSKLRKQLFELIDNKGAIATTMLFDFYRFHTKDKIFSGIKRTNRDCYELVVDFEKAIENDIGSRIRGKVFIPFLFLHELEALLFVSPDRIATLFPGHIKEIAKEIQKIKTKHKNLPETIDDNVATSPSHRISDLIQKHSGRNYSNSSK